MKYKLSRVAFKWIGAALLTLGVSISSAQAVPLHQGMAVATSPLLGLRSAFDASDLIVNLPTMNEDLRLLEQRKALEKQVSGKGQARCSISHRPFVELSGALEAQGVLERDYSRKTGHDIDLTKFSLDALMHVNPWVIGLATLEHDNAPAPFVVSPRVANSSISLKRVFFTIGNLSRAPIYMSVGQMYVPFGTYKTHMLSAPLTQRLGRTLQRAVLVGFVEGNFFGSTYASHGDTFIHNNNVINLWGVNLGYKRVINRANLEVGAGFINSIADSEGMQTTGVANGQFDGFGFTTENLSRRVPGVDLHAELGWGPWGLFSEYVTAAGHGFNAEDLSFNRVGSTETGAKPRALHLEGSYRLHSAINPVFKRSVLISLGYDRSWNALALNLPRKALTVGVSTSFFRNTIQSVEYKFQKNYSSQYEAEGAGFAPVASVGSHSNTLTLQTGVYF